MFELLLTTKLLQLLGPNDVGFTETLADSKSSGDWGALVNLVPDPDNNCIYMYGGLTSGSAMNKATGRYDIATNTITSLAAMTINETRNTGGVLLDNKIYAFRSDLINIYDIATNEWSSIPGRASNTAFYFEQPAVCLVGRTVYLFGYPSDYNTFGMVLVKYEIDTNTWSLVSTLRKLPLSAYPSMIHHNGELYITGGDADSTVTTVYNIANNTWRTIAGNDRIFVSILATTEDGMYSFHTTDKYIGVTGMDYTSETFQQLPELSYINSYPRLVAPIGKVAYLWGKPVVGGNFRFTSYRMEKPAPNTGPGPQEFLVGDTTNGYYGNLTSTEFFKSSELATAVGLTGNGAMLNEDSEWMKVSLDGKTLYVPFKQLRTSLSWNFYDQYNLTGRPGQPKKIIEKGGLKYWVRMMTGLGPGQPLTAGEDPVQCVGSEFNRIMYRMCKEAANMPTPRFADYSVDDLNLGRAGTGPAGANLSGIILCQESAVDEVRQVAIRNLFNGIAATNAWTASGIVLSSIANSDYGWRPVLELVD